MTITNDDKQIVFEWIKDVSDDMIIPLYKQAFSDLSLSILQSYFNKNILCKRRYQLMAASSLYISSCFDAEYPLPIEHLWTLCDYCYDPGEIIDAIYELSNWIICEYMSLDESSLPMLFIRKLCEHDSSICDLVSSADGCLYVCKKISHTRKHLPSPLAMVELCTHYIICMDDEKTPVTNICSLENMSVMGTECHLYYRYHPTKFQRFRLQMGSTIISYISQLSAGLNTLHAKDIAHRDLKPDNIQISDGGIIHIIDFGACGHGKTRITVPICTITHRSPDILKNEISGKPCTYDGKQLDMWSFGVIVAELILGTYLFGKIYTTTTNEDTLLMIEYVLASTRDRLREKIDSQPIVDMVVGCLHIDPLKRLTIQQVIRIINRL
jgi:hypothetical protein